jgi:hypothetical protein
MRRDKVVKLFPLDLEIDRTLKTLSREKRLTEAMAHQPRIQASFTSRFKQIISS